MRRELLIAAAVLVPFGVLVALGFYFSTPAAPAPQPGAIALAPPAPPPVQPATPRDDAEVQVDSGPPRVAVVTSAPRPVDPGWPAALAAPLAAIAPEVHRCFADERARLRETVTTRVRFTPTRDGGFSGVAVETTTQDPWLRACVEDAFDEVRFAPTGAELFVPAEHTFGFDPSVD